jgi:hypothetical protein
MHNFHAIDFANAATIVAIADALLFVYQFLGRKQTSGVWNFLLRQRRGT